MFTATKEFNFEAAHMLVGHTGKCRNLHGHNYKVLVEVAATNLNEMDMVKDFYDIAQNAKPMFDQFDHAFIYNVNCNDEFETEIYNTCIKYGRKVIEIPYRATAENMARLFYETLKFHGEPVSKVTVYETPTSFASFTEDNI